MYCCKLQKLRLAGIWMDRGYRKRKMEIKQQTVGIGRPLVCVPIVETEENDIYKAAEFAAASGAQVCTD